MVQKTLKEVSRMKLYLLITNDQYELPLAVADTPTELSQMTGYKRSYIKSALSKFDKGERPNAPFRRIEVDDDEKE